MGRPRSKGGRRHQAPREPKTRINRMIRVPMIRVIDVDGEMLGVMPPDKALGIAADRGVDLVEIAPNAKPPVCKIIDYGKYQFEQKKREKQQKKTGVSKLKEVKFKLATDTHDFDFKTRHARDFIKSGHKVKATVFFRGREIVHKDLGIELLKKFVAQMEDIAKIDQNMKMEGPNCSVIMAPDKTKGTKPEE